MSDLTTEHNSSNINKLYLGFNQLKVNTII